MTKNGIRHGMSLEFQKVIQQVLPEIANDIAVRPEQPQLPGESTSCVIHNRDLTLGNHFLRDDQITRVEIAVGTEAVRCHDDPFRNFYIRI